MCIINLAFYSVSLVILYYPLFCKGATHWIVTEDGRIQQQADSIFNLKSPHDLVTFIHQQNAFERLKILREEYLIEKRKVIEAREKEREEIQKSFYKMDADCLEAGNHISEFELHLEMTLSFSSKGINIPDHVNLCQPLPQYVEPPLCRAELPTVTYSYDHLEGINHRQQLNTSMEPTLLTALSSYFKTADELGGRVSLALDENSTSWVVLNLAAYYWRIKGNALEAVECLRRALYFSPREHKDRALMSLAAVLHHSNHSQDSVVLLHSAVDSCSELSVYHFLLGNIYASLKMYEMANLCYRFTMVFSPNTETLCERIKAVRCELKLEELLQKRELDFDEKLDSLKTPELDETKDPSKEKTEKKHAIPLEVYKQQLNQVFSLYTRGRAQYSDACKSRAVLANQESPKLSSFPSGAKGQQSSPVRNQEIEKSHFNQDINQQNTQNTASGIESTPVEKQATPHSQFTHKSGEVNEEGITYSDEKGGQARETLRAKNSVPDSNNNISAEEKTMQNLAEARLALNRLEDVVKTASRSHYSASSTVGVNEGKRPDSGLIASGENKAKRIPDHSESSTVESTGSVGETKSQVEKFANPARRSRRGESGLKISESYAHSREDTAKFVITEETKIPRQKGESTLMSKNSRPGVESFASKNTREISDADVLFEDNKGGHPFGPKHTPPLETKHVLYRTSNCENLGGKKRKGEVFAMECLTQDPSKEDEGVLKQTISKTELAEAGIQKGTQVTKTLALQSDAEAMLMDNSSTDEILTSASSNSSSTGSTSEAKAVEEHGINASGATALVGSEDRHVNDGNVASENSKSELVEQSQMTTAVKNAEDSKLSFKESDGLKQHEPVVASGRKVSDAKGVEEGEAKISSLDSLPSGKESEGDFKKSEGSTSAGEKSRREQGKSELKTSVANLERKSGGDENSNMEEHDRTTSTAKTSKGQKVTATLDPEQRNVEFKSRQAALNSDTTSRKVKGTEYLHRIGTGSSVFETNFLNVPTSGSLQELNDDECKHIEGVQALVIRNKHFSAWLSLDTKNIDLQAHIDFLNEVDDFTKKPRCTAKVKSNSHTFSSFQGALDASNLDQVAEAGLTQTLLTVGRTIQSSVDEMGTRIYNALRRNSTSWVLLNVASLYWRVQGDTVEAIKCLRQALYFSPSHTRDVAHVGLASILLREGLLDETAVVIKKALEISPSLALGHFILGSVFGAQSNIPDAIQHYLLALQLEPGFTPAVERLKIIQCVLWKQQKALEKEAEDLRKLLTPKRG